MNIFIKKTVICWVILCFFLIHSFSYAENLTFNKKDYSCGPKCILAFLKVIEKKSNIGSIDDIYKILNKSNNKPISLLDIKYVLGKLGISSQGYKYNELTDIEGYAILPIKANGDGALLHFILVKEIAKPFVTIVDTQTLKLIDYKIAELEKLWDGHALLLSVGNGKKGVSTVNNIKYVTKDFGIVDSGVKLEHSFDLTNNSEVNCNVKIISKTCSCIKPKIDKNTIKPGESTHVTMELHVTKPGWSSESVAVQLDPIGTIMRLTIKAFGKNSYEVLPTIGFIEVIGNEIIEYPIKITYFSSIDDSVSFVSMETEIENIKTGKIIKEEENEGAYKAFKYVIPILYEKEQDEQEVRREQGKIFFHFKTSEGERIIPLEMTVSPQKNFTLTPEKIFLMVSKNSNKIINKTIELKFNENALHGNLVTELSLNIPVDIIINRKDINNFSITLVLVENKLNKIPRGLHKGILKIKTTENNSITRDIVDVPVAVYVKDF